MKKNRFWVLLWLMAILVSCTDESNSEPNSSEQPSSSVGYVFSSKSLSDEPQTRSVSENAKLWAKGSTIKIKFLNGKASAKNKVKEVAAEWLKYTSLQFEYVGAADEADVKIGFQLDDDRVTWSYIGTDCKAIAQDEPSMNLALFFGDDAEINSEDFKACILREFGHVIGLGLEHRNPMSKIKWDKTRVTNYLRSSGWSQADIEETLQLYSTSATNYTDFDPNSIMLLFFPDHLTTDGKGTQWNTQLSEKDIELVSFLYEDKTLPQSYSLHYTQDNGKTYYDYKGVRIGEYYWVNNNFNHQVPRNWNNLEGWENEYPMSQARLDKYLPGARLQTSQYQVNIDDFVKYYGIYYNRESIDYMTRNGKVYEDNNTQPTKSWQLPSYVDFQQLFAMCPFFSNGENEKLGEVHVRMALEPKEGANPLAFNLYDPQGGPFKTYWFNTGDNIGIYDFNLMPTGAKLNGSGPWFNGLDDPHYGDRGDIYHLFYTAGFYTKESHVYIHDYIDTRNPYSYHWFTARWCKPLSDLELGYKLYVNESKKDIIKLDLDEKAPSDYKELAKGYLRGFYVQYILDQENPKYTTAQLFDFAKKVSDTTL